MKIRKGRRLGFLVVLGVMLLAVTAIGQVRFGAQMNYSAVLETYNVYYCTYDQAKSYCSHAYPNTRWDPNQYPFFVWCEMDAGGVWDNPSDEWWRWRCRFDYRNFGYFTNSTEGDILFPELHGNAPTAEAQRQMYDPCEVGHVMYCHYSSGSNCTIQVDQHAYNAQTYQWEVDVSDGLLPNACEVLASWNYPVYIQRLDIFQQDGFMGRNATRSHDVDGFVFRDDGFPLNHPNWHHPEYHPYQIGGYSEYVPYAGCSEAVSDYVDLRAEEGGRSYVNNDMNHIRSAAGNISDMIVDDCESEANWYEWVALRIFGVNTCYKVANQLINTFMNRCNYNTSNYYYTLHPIGPVSGPQDELEKIRAGSAPYCGDGSCNGGETCSTCSTDCGGCGGGY
jgi:hypothetical protein